MKDYKLCQISSKPIYFFDEHGFPVEISYTADAIMLEALVGAKAGNSLIDYNNLIQKILEDIKKSKLEKELDN